MLREDCKASKSDRPAGMTEIPAMEQGLNAPRELDRLARLVYADFVKANELSFRWLSELGYFGGDESGVGTMTLPRRETCGANLYVLAMVLEPRMIGSSNPRKIR